MTALLESTETDSHQISSPGRASATLALVSESDTKRPLPESELLAMLPPNPRTQKGHLRRVGFELELAGLSVGEAAEVVCGVLGGRVEPINPFRHKVSGSAHGDYTIELDADLLASGRLRKTLQEVTMEGEDGEWMETLERTLAQVAGTVVPLEVVTPPLPLDAFDELERVREALRQRGAVGTDASLFYAFGMHLNPEVARASTEHLLAVLRSFLVSYEKLCAWDGGDWTRRLLPYIDPFPPAYERLVLDADYDPDRARLVDDYLDYNPTRNRPLDLLPLFAGFDAAAVEAAVDDQRVKARPTYHFRLPSCRIDDADWRASTAWTQWVEVERLAADGERLREACRKRLLALEEKRHPFSTALEAVFE
jgi:hypothetical protein